jgi:hypothetical protein
VYTLFAPYSSSYLFPHHLPPLNSANTTRLNLSHPPVLQFCRRKNIKDKKRSMTFLLVWDKESYKGSFLAMVPRIYALRPQLVHLYQTSPLPPSSLSMVASASLRFLYSFPDSEHINHIPGFGVPPLRELPLACDPCPTILLHLF